MALYSAVVQEHFHHPRRVGPLVGATHSGTAGTPGEGPYMSLWLRVSEGIIQQAAYQSWGCPAAIASASGLCELLEGRSIECSAELAEGDIVWFLGGLPEGKEHCPRLAIAALVSALEEGHLLPARE